MGVVLHAQFQGTWCETIDISLGTVEDADPTLLRNCNGEADRQKKRSGLVGAECPSYPAMSKEFAGLWTKAVPHTQTLCVTAKGGGVNLTTLKTKVANKLPLKSQSIVGRRTILFDANH